MCIYIFNKCSYLSRQSDKMTKKTCKLDCCLACSSKNNVQNVFILMFKVIMFITMLPTVLYYCLCIT